ncbi:MAG: restriction endonuclease subunit S [Myxococcales bacterium]|nr:restriction endonuclease subunit S [Myxococcales bacterium]
MRTARFESLLAEPLRNGLTKPSAVRGTGVKLVNMKEIFSLSRIRNAPMDRAPLEANEVHSLLAPGDLLFARQSLTLEGAGKCSIFIGDGEPVCFESHIIRCRLDKKNANPHYYYYYFTSRRGKRSVASIVEQVAAAGIRGRDLARLEVPWPSLEQQNSVCKVLIALDEKIELNRQMNETLEAMARALFKSWFVDFDPVRAKMAGRAPFGMDAATAAMFPSSLASGSEYPAGWVVADLGSLVSVLETGGRPKGGVRHITCGIPSVGAESISRVGDFDFSKTRYVPEDYYHAMTKGRVEDRDVLLYKDGGRPGEFEPHVSMFGDGFPFAKFGINEHVYRIRSRPPVTQAFLYFQLASDSSLDEMRRRGTGVAIPGLNSTSARALSFPLPPAGLVAAFSTVAEPLLARIFANGKESRTLAELRDLLLPKLLSGELRIREAERAVEAAL